jgi:hypothetical protein
MLNEKNTATCYEHNVLNDHTNMLYEPRITFAVGRCLTHVFHLHFYRPMRDSCFSSFQDNAGQVDRSSIVVSPVDSPTDSRNCSWGADGFTDSEEPATEPEPSS